MFNSFRVGIEVGGSKPWVSPTAIVVLALQANVLLFCANPISIITRNQIEKMNGKTYKAIGQYAFP